MLHGRAVVVGCFLVTFALPITVWSFGVFFLPLEDQFGWSRALLSSAYTSFLVAYAVSAIIMGRAADRYGPRIVLAIGAVIAGTGIALCSLINSIDQLWLFYSIAGLGSGVGFGVPAATVQRWFQGRKRQGIALGIVSSGVGLGGLIFTPLLSYLIGQYGWRQTYLIAGAFFFVAMLLSSLLVDRNPSNRVDMRQTNQFGTKPLSGPVDGLSTRKAVMSLSFIGILVLFIVAVLSFNVLATHLIPYAADSDISPLEAAAALGLLGGVSVPARIFSGYISDRFGYRKILAWSTLLMGLSMLWLIRLETAWMLYAFVIFYGISAGARTTVHFGIIGNFFGMRSLAELTGIVIATGILISAGGTYLAGLIFDLYGSYFAIIIGMLIALVITGLLAFRLKPPETIKQETSG